MKKKIESIKKKLIDNQGNSDCELAHCNADDLLCDLLILLGHEDIVIEYNKIEKWYA